MSDEYETFLSEKLRTSVQSGFEPGGLHPDLFEFQRFIVRRALVAGLRKARQVFAAPALARWTTQETLPGNDTRSDEQLLDYAMAKGVSGYHLVGTCRMGGLDAVVDPCLKVRGVDGLRVIDASVMPTCTTGNTNAPTLMIAEKGAAMVLADA